MKPSHQIKCKPIAWGYWCPQSYEFDECLLANPKHTHKNAVIISKSDYLKLVEEKCKQKKK